MRTAWSSAGLAEPPRLRLTTAGFCAFAVTQSRKRVETAAEAKLSRVRVDELQRVLTFGNALAGSLDEEALQRTLCQQLPAFFGERGYWLLARRDTSWVEIAQAAPAPPEKFVRDIVNPAIHRHVVTRAA